MNADSFWDDDSEETIEVVEEMIFEEVVDEPGQPTVEARALVADGFGHLLAVLEDVARTFGAPPATARTIRALLGEEPLEPSILSTQAEEALVGGGLLVRTERGIARTRAFTAEAHAWRGVLRDEVDDFSGCGPLALDEWCGNLLARAAGSPGRAEAYRRECRRRGVAAFGLMEHAA